MRRHVASKDVGEVEWNPESGGMDVLQGLPSSALGGRDNGDDDDDAGDEMTMMMTMVMTRRAFFGKMYGPH